MGGFTRELAQTDNFRFILATELPSRASLLLGHVFPDHIASSFLSKKAGEIHDCDDKQSREHYISKALFEGPSVGIIGLPWCKDEPKTIGKASATAKILCKRHNERLSALDAEAGKAFETMRQIAVALHNETSKGYVVRREWRISGRVLELWFLKTMINMACVTGLRWPTGSDAINPPLQLVKACFGMCPLVPPVGLKVAAMAGQRFKSRDEVVFLPLLRADTKEIGVGVFEFRGFHFVVPLEDKDFTPYLQAMAERKDDLRDWLNCRVGDLRIIKFRRGDHTSHVVKLVWPPFRRSAHGAQTR